MMILILFLRLCKLFPQNGRFGCEVNVVTVDVVEAGAFVWLEGFDEGDGFARQGLYPEEVAESADEFGECGAFGGGAHAVVPDVVATLAGADASPIDGL
jgi:hypothetical protein